MAAVWFLQPVNMSASGLSFPVVSEMTGSRIVIVDNGISYELTGTFSGRPPSLGSNDMISGVVTGYLSRAGATVFIDATGLNADAWDLTAAILIQRDAQLAFEIALQGNDWFFGSGFGDGIDGHEGTDTIFGGSGRDTLNGMLGNDLIFGGPDQDMITGGNGADSISGDEGADSVYGNAGNDTLAGGAGTDIVGGGSGNDLVVSGNLGAFEAAAEAVYRIYQATLDRAPDVGGLIQWANARVNGANLGDIARGFVNSQEFQNRYNDTDSTAFVTLLYNNVLSRAPDATGLIDWVGRLETGTSRQDVVLGFSESAEFIASTRIESLSYGKTLLKASFTDDLYRVYGATLGREPDFAGLDGWADKMASGTSYQSVVAGFVRSAEFQQTYGSLSDSGFVSLLYQNVLERSPDSEGLQTWLDRLATGWAREKVVEGFAQSVEYRAATEQPLKQWMQVDPTDSSTYDRLAGASNGGAGVDTLVGGFAVDMFVFVAADGAGEGSHDTIVGLEAWDMVIFEDFGYGDASNALPYLSQVGTNVVFEDQGHTAVFRNADLSCFVPGMVQVEETY
ncbi:DUF4214 domain-containing protein [Mesobacterium sp. TK19101]|uniref:DUF4214 domain-containing protein n=1 Tax=Mesobacterium hydrothermale TaxID=3111907 RepID=A0ABU6HEU3_9RHOB|nr:DUF4214 domain-containing protein [Mesobacterium sp. TK19101]MEC3860184.1 DUF4214 domain-containing protein [Mesobacterium sp. TK19101]